MKPTSLVPSSMSSLATGGGQPADKKLGSESLITGLVGLAVLGFLITSEDKPEQEQDRT